MNADNLSLESLTADEINRAHATAQTPECRAALRNAVERHKAGEPFNFYALADETGLPVAFVVAGFQEAAARQGLDIRPIGRTQ